MSRNKARQWEIEYEDGHDTFGEDVCGAYEAGDNRYKGQKLLFFRIGEWLKVELLEGKNNSKEVYSVKFGDIEYIVRLTDKNEYMVRLAWADSFVQAKPTNIGQLNNDTANAKKKKK